MRRPIAVVTTFGLGRTPVQIGMMQALANRGLEADYVIGTSLGAINAAALAAGRSGEQLREFWAWAHEEVFGSPVRALARGLTAKQARRQQGNFSARLEELLPGSFAELATPLRLVATDLASGSEVVLDSGDLQAAVKASCAVPGVFPPVEVEDAYLIDGGVVAGMPLLTVPDDVGTVIVLDTGHSAVSLEAAGGYRWWEVAALSYAHQIRGQAVNALVRTVRHCPVVMLSTDSGKMLDFPQPDALIEAGLTAAEEQLTRLPGRLRRGIYNLPPGLDEFEVLRARQAGP